LLAGFELLTALLSVLLLVFGGVLGAKVGGFDCGLPEFWLENPEVCALLSALLLPPDDAVPSSAPRTAFRLCFVNRIAAVGV
jgi:hypothetical protein